MDSAINKKTGELVKAFEVHKNGSYQDLTRGEWIAPNDSIENLDENLTEEDLHIHYIKHKEYKNWRGTLVWCSPHFALYPNSKAKTVAESKEHKLLKNWLFNRLKNDDLQLIYSKAGKKYKYDNCIKLSELDIDWNKYDIEVRTKGYKCLIADILLSFKKRHPFLGEGIFFEIQLSSQTEEQTFDRTFARAIQGYSTIWLFEKDFDFNEDKTDIELKDNKLKVYSFSSQLKYGGKKFVRNLKLTVEKQCRLLDEKQKEIELSLDLFKERGEEIINELLKRVQTREAIIFNKLVQMENNPFESLVKGYIENINVTSNQERDRITALSNAHKQDIIDLQKKFSPRVIECSCGGNMIFKITPQKGKELYECMRCRKVVWLK